MRKLKLLLAAAALFGVSTAWAQTDVTSTYLTNADFATDPAINAEGTAVDEASSSNKITPTGWTDKSSGDWPRYGVLPLGYSDTQYNFMNSTNPPASDTEHTGYTLAISGSWGSTPMIYQTSKLELPVGYYELTVEVYNNSNITNALQGNKIAVYSDAEMTNTLASATTTVYPSNSWKKETLSFTITEAQNVTFALGIYGNGGGAGSNQKLFLANLNLTWTDLFKGAKDALQAEIDKAKLCDTKEGLARAINAAEGVLASATTVTELEYALAALQAADKDAVLRYDNGLTDATYAAPIVTGFVVNGTFDSNVDGWTSTGNFQNRGLKDATSGTLNKFWENWTPQNKTAVNKMYQTITNIPNGTYRLNISAFVNTLDVENQYVFANTSKTNLTAEANPGADYEVYTVVTTNQIEIGLEQTTATANWMGIDNVSLRYYGAGDVINDAKNAAHKLAWAEAKTAAETAIADAAYANVTGQEKNDLQTDLDKAEPTTAQGYDDAAADLTSATSAFTAAKAVYDAYYEIRGISVTLGIEPGDAPENAAAAPAATHTLNVAVFNATQAANIFDVTKIYNPSWSNMSTSSEQHWSGDASISYADEWRGDTNPTTRTATVTLPAGSYILMSAGRGSANTITTMSANDVTVTFASNGDVGLGINKKGAASFDSEDADGFANKKDEAENTGTGWEWRYIPVKLTEETAVTVTQTLKRLESGWGSFSDFRIMKVGVVATSSDYAALNSAIKTAEGKTLGFEPGEFAPYNNIDALKALAAAKAIDQEQKNDQDAIQAITTALTDAIWASNTEDVDAIYNGLFATVTEGANYPEGWTRTNNWGQMQSGLEGDFATAYYNQPGSLQYGNQDVYTMPLAANQAYKLTFSYRSHENTSNKGMKVSVLKGEEGLAEASFDGNGSTSEWKTVEAYFTTGTAGDYVLTLNNSGNTWITNVSLVKFVPDVITITSAGFATYASDIDIDFTNVEGLTAYKATINGSTATFTKVTKVPAGEGVLLKGAAGKYNCPVTAGVTAWAEEDNAFVRGNDAAVPTNDGTTYNYVLSTKNGVVGFYSAADKTVAKNQAYLQTTKSEGRLSIVFEDGTTGISSVMNADSNKQNEVYNLNGQRVKNAAKGLYIQNGKKVLVK